MFKKRIKFLKNFFLKNNLDSFLISNFYNILYLSGLKTLTENEREAWLLITNKNNYLLTDVRYLISFKQNSNNNFLIFKLITPEKGLIFHLKEIIKNEKIKKLAVEGDNLKVNEFNNLKQALIETEIILTNKTIINQRSIKDEQEIEKIKKTCQIADNCLKDITKTIKLEQTEKEIAFKIEFWLKEKGFDLAFYPIVAIDKNSAIPHYDTRTNGLEKVKKQSVILIDFGAKYQEYLSDITRVVFIGKPTSQQINVYNKLLSIQEKTLNFSQKNFLSKDLDFYCRQLYQQENLPQCSHSIGHGIGLEIHEYPKIIFLSEEKIVNNQVFTIEPGVYFKNQWGIRIEDTVLFKNKIIPLTKYPKLLYHHV